MIITRFLSMLLTPLDYAAAVYLVARGVMLAPDPPSWLRDFERAPVPNGCAPPPVTCDGCGASMGEECSPSCPYGGRPCGVLGCKDPHCEGRPVPPPVVSCCYCGKPQTSKVHGCLNEDNTAYHPLCRACWEDDETTGYAVIMAKLAADRAQAAVSARTEEAGELGKAPGLDAAKALPRCGMPTCPIPGCQR